jgi:hypothetical protein
LDGCSHVCRYVFVLAARKRKMLFFFRRRQLFRGGFRSLVPCIFLCICIFFLWVIMHVLTRTQPSAPCVHAPGRDWWTNVVALASPAVSPPSWVTQDDFFFTLGLSVRATHSITYISDVAAPLGLSVRATHNITYISDVAAPLGLSVRATHNITYISDVAAPLGHERQYFALGICKCSALSLMLTRHDVENGPDIGSSCNMRSLSVHSLPSCNNWLQR